DRDRVFEPFQRLGDRPSGDGVGLGLAVARGFIEAMGGDLHIEDTPGGGVTMVGGFEAAACRGSSSSTTNPRSCGASGPTFGPAGTTWTRRRTAAGPWPSQPTATRISSSSIWGCPISMGLR